MFKFKYWIFSLLIKQSLSALTVLNVTSSSDNEPGGRGENGDLRYCLNSMNHDLNNGSNNDYAIVFAFPMLIQLNGNLPLINSSSRPATITIGNSGSLPTVTIDGNDGEYSGFFIPNGNVTIQNMIFQNLAAKGGNGGSGISGAGGGMGAGGGIYAPQTFLNGTSPTITLKNVRINNCSAIGGNGGSYLGSSSTGDEGGGGGGGFGGNGGSITTTGSTGGGGGGGFGGNGGDVTLSSFDTYGGGGGGGGGIGSRAGILVPTPTNLGNGGSDVDPGQDGNGYDLSITAGSGAGNYLGGSDCGGGGGGSSKAGGANSGGGGGGSSGSPGLVGIGTFAPGGGIQNSGGRGGDGGGGGGAGVIIPDTSDNSIQGQGGSGGYGGGGGGGAGLGFRGTLYTVQGGTGGVGGGGGGGGGNDSGTTPANGGDSLGGGGGGGGGPSTGINALGGVDQGALGGGKGGDGANNYGAGFGGGGGGGGSGLGGAIFVDTGVALTIQALPSIPTTFNTSNNTVQAGNGGTAGSGGGTDGLPGTALGNNIFLRSNSLLRLVAEDNNDLLILGDQVTIVDDTDLTGLSGNTNVLVIGNGTVIYNGNMDYQGKIQINNATFKVNGQIDRASISVCRDTSISLQRGTLSGTGILTGNVSVNSGVISPDSGGSLTLGSLVLNSANPGSNILGSLVHIEIDAHGTSSVSINGAATLAGILELELDSNARSGAYTILTSSAITGTFDSISFSGVTPSSYTLAYLPIGSPTFVQFEFLGDNPAYPILSTQSLYGNNLRVANYLNNLAPNADVLGLSDQLDLLMDLPFSQYKDALEAISPSRNSIPSFVAQNVMFGFSESLNSHFIKRRLAHYNEKNRYAKKTAFLADADPEYLLARGSSYGRKNKPFYLSPKNTNSEVWGMGFGQFGHQKSQHQTPAFGFNSGGFFTAYDCGNMDQGCIGALAGYAYTSIHEQQSMGRGHFNAGYLSLFGIKYFSNFFIDAAIWGQYMRVNQKRNIAYSGFKTTATSSYNAEQLDCHLGLGYDFNIRTLTLEPFSLLDWVFEWDSNYTEKGGNPYNMKVSSKNSWMLRSQTGLNSYKTIMYSWGVLIAQAQLSYVYKKAHNVGQIHAAIVNAPASFVVEAFTSGQSLISPAIELLFQTKWNGYASINYSGEFLSGYISNQFNIAIGYSF